MWMSRWIHFTCKYSHTADPSYSFAILASCQPDTLSLTIYNERLILDFKQTDACHLHFSYTVLPVHLGMHYSAIVASFFGEISWKWSAVLRFYIFAPSSVPAPHKPWWHYLISCLKTFHAGNSYWNKKIFPLTCQPLLPPSVMKPIDLQNINAAHLIQLVTVLGNNHTTIRNLPNHQSVVAVYDRLGCWSLPAQDDQDKLYP